MDVDVAATSLTLATAALRSDGTPTIRTSPAAGATTIGDPGSAVTSATRTKVVTAPCRSRRASSAIIPMAMMSWLDARDVRSASKAWAASL